MYGTFYNISESIELGNKFKRINIFCNKCLLKDCEIYLSCRPTKPCPISFNNFKMEGGQIKVINISLTLSNIFMEDTIIEGTLDLNEIIYDELHFEN